MLLGNNVAFQQWKMFLSCVIFCNIRYISIVFNICFIPLILAVRRSVKQLCNIGGTSACVNIVHIMVSSAIDQVSKWLLSSKMSYCHHTSIYLPMSRDKWITDPSKSIKELKILKQTLKVWTVGVHENSTAETKVTTGLHSLK